MDDELRRELARVLNVHDVDNLANTPDFVLADYLVGCLAAYTAAKECNDEWHGGPNRTLEDVIAAQRAELLSLSGPPDTERGDSDA